MLMSCENEYRSMVARFVSVLRHPSGVFCVYKRSIFCYVFIFYLVWELDDMNHDVMDKAQKYKHTC